MHAPFGVLPCAAGSLPPVAASAAAISAAAAFAAATFAFSGAAAGPPDESVTAPPRYRAPISG